MKITVRMFFVPADVTFDTSKVTETDELGNDAIMLWFKNRSNIVVDKQHYFEQITK